MAAQLSADTIDAVLRVYRERFGDDAIPPLPPIPISLADVSAVDLEEVRSLPRPFRRHMTRELRAEAAKAIGCRALRHARLEHLIHAAPLFTVWQRIKYRLVYDLRIFNSVCDDATFRMETLSDVPIIAAGCKVGGKLDLASAYWQYPLADDLSAALGCFIDGRPYRWACLPFGLSMAPRTFTALLHPFIVAWRRIGIRVVAYLDDIAVFADDPAQYAEHVAIVVNDLAAAGIRIAAKKAFLTPMTRFEFLGLLIDLTRQAFSVSTDRQARLASEAQEVLSDPSRSSLESFLGRTAFCGLACPWISFFRPSLTADLAAIGQTAPPLPLFRSPTTVDPSSSGGGTLHTRFCTVGGPGHNCLPHLSTGEQPFPPRPTPTLAPPTPQPTASASDAPTAPSSTNLSLPGYHPTRHRPLARSTAWLASSRVVPSPGARWRDS